MERTTFRQGNDKLMYEYKISNIDIIDGDTVDADIDLGFGLKLRERIRLFGIDTPETRTRDLEEKKRGLEAKDRLRELIQESKAPITIQTKFDSRGKFGRVLGTLHSYIQHPEDSFFDRKSAVKVDINKQLVSEGHAVVYMSK